MNKIPYVTREKAEEIAAQYPTPFYLYDEKGIRENAKAVKEAFAWNPGFREYFAVKATPNPYIMDIFRDYGFGFDCSSMTELMLSNAVGASGHEIMFSSNDTPAQEYAFAAKLGAIINLDDITHIPFLEKILDGKFPETMSLRYNPGGVFQMSNGIMDNPGDSKYGFTKAQLFEGYRILRDKGVKHFGLHAFLASNTVSNDYYPELAGRLFSLAAEAQRELGIHFAFINLSGGVGVPYRKSEVPNDIRVIGEGVREKYERILVPAGMGDVAIYTEMGRFMLAPYGALVTRAIHSKHIYKEYIGVDACAANLMRSLCENNDKFAIDRELPRIDQGDLLFIHDAGAHGFAMGYNYNGRLWSAELLLKEDGSVQQIRRAQEPRDYFATFDQTPYYAKMFPEG